MKFKFIISAVLAGFCSIANAQEPGDMDVGLGFSSLGPALQGRYVFFRKYCHPGHCFYRFEQEHESDRRRYRLQLQR